MRLWIVGGGTAGHVYPALAIALALRDIDPSVELTWVGTLKGMEGDLVRRHDIPFIGLPGGGLHGVALLNAVRNGWDLVRAVFVAGKQMRAEQPGAMLDHGGVRERSCLRSPPGGTGCRCWYSYPISSPRSR